MFAGTNNEPENPEAIPLNVDGMLEINNQRCPEMVAVSDHIVHDRQKHGPYRPAF